LPKLRYLGVPRFSFKDEYAERFLIRHDDVLEVISIDGDETSSTFVVSEEDQVNRLGISELVAPFGSKLIKYHQRQFSSNLQYLESMPRRWRG
jgi:hypothetical protein